MLLSRIAGLVRQSVFAAYVGNGPAADAFNAAFRIPNVLQNLLGEGAVSASFVPVYTRLRAEGRHDDAAKLAGAVAARLLALTVMLVALGVVAAPWLTAVIAPGFTGPRAALAVTLVRVFFPAIGFLVIAAWALGVLNSHKRYFLPYVAPVASSAVVVAALLYTGRAAGHDTLAHVAAWATLAGAAAQLVVQLPSALGLVRGGGLTLARNPDADSVAALAGPSVLSRGAAQLSAYVDQVLASFLPEGCVATLAYAQTVYLLPVSLFGASVSTAALTEMSSLTGTEAEVNQRLVVEIDRGQRRIALFVVPSSVALVAHGGAIATLLFQRGAFSAHDARAVWAALAGASVGLVGQTFARLHVSAFNALRDTRTPARVSTLRLMLTAGLGALGALVVPRVLGVSPHWGTFGLTVTAGLAGWVEYLALRRALHCRLGAHGAPAWWVARLWLLAGVAALVAYGCSRYMKATPATPPWFSALATLVVFGLTYGVLALLSGVEEVRALARRLRWRRRTP
jgi:putative peptidoglycan lipid II flippase